MQQNLIQRLSAHPRTMTEGYGSAQGDVEYVPSSPCRVAAFYEDSHAREWLLWFCQGLANRFETEVEFAVTWWKFKFLGDSHFARLAAAEAGQADILLYSWSGTLNVPLHLIEFNELWLPHRDGRTGFLMGLSQNTDLLHVRTSAWPAYLHEVAQRARMAFAVEFISAFAIETRHSSFTGASPYPLSSGTITVNGALKPIQMRHSLSPAASPGTYSGLSCAT